MAMTREYYNKKKFEAIMQILDIMENWDLTIDELKTFKK
jgi:hypothetical protein